MSWLLGLFLPHLFLQVGVKQLLRYKSITGIKRENLIISRLGLVIDGCNCRSIYLQDYHSFCGIYSRLKI